MISTDNTALIIIDIQGKLATLMHDKDHFLQQTCALIQGAKILQLPIIWAEQLPDKLGATVPEVAQLLAELKPYAKSSFSCCGDAALSAEIAKLNKQYFLVAGIETHICVFQTVIDLLARDKIVHVLADATSSRTLSNKMIGLQRMEKSGAIISSVEMSLFEILAKAGGEQFRAISKVVK